MSADNHSIIHLDHVSRVYQVGESEVRALDDVSLDIAPGEFAAIMGPSGSGKSTMLNVLGCLDTPTAGRYVLDGEPVERLSEDQLANVRQRKIGFVFQAYHLVGRMTAARNVELPLVFAGVEPRIRRDQVRAALAAGGLARRMTHRPDLLAGGERQRVAIARAMVTQPRLLLADEPTGNLDSATGERVTALMFEASERAGATLMLVTHNQELAARCDRIARIEDGRLLAAAA